MSDFTRVTVSVVSVEEEYAKHPTPGLKCFIEFLHKLDWDKTQLCYEETNTDHAGYAGYRVIHFPDKVEDKWHNIWGQTWFGLSTWMS